MSKHHIQPECGEYAGWRGAGRPNPSREAKFSGANGDRDIYIYFPCSADHGQDWQPYPVGPYSATCDGHTNTLNASDIVNMPTSYQLWMWEKERRTLVGPW